MSHRYLVVLSVIAAGAIARHTAFAAVDPASRCQGKKLKAVGVVARDLLRCHTQAALAGSAVSGACLGRGERKLGSAFRWADAQGGCLTLGDATHVHGALSAGVAGIATMLRPDTVASICTSNKLFSAGRAAARLLKAFAKERKRSREKRLSRATADFRGDLEEDFTEIESGSADCRTRDDGRAVAERVLTLAGDATLRLWPLARSGLTLTPPAGLSADGVVFAMTDGDVLQFRNFAQAQVVPFGGVEMTISRFPLPSGPLSEYVDREARGSQRLSSSSVTVGGETGTRVVYRDDYDAGIRIETTVVYVPHGNSLHRFSLEPTKGSFVSAFDALLSSVVFVP